MAANSKNKSFLERHVALVFTIVFALIGGIIALVATNAAAGQGEIRSKVTANKCLDNSNNRKINGNKIQLQNCNNTAAQKWTVPPAVTPTPTPGSKKEPVL